MANLFGLYRGTVTLALDPLVLGRVQVATPVLGLQPSTWAMPCVPYASGGAAIDVPPVGTEVWIAFEGSDPDMPVWMGVLPRR